MKPDWLPDWRDANAYPDPEANTARQWAWEFLRRNSKYQKDCEKVPVEFFQELRNTLKNALEVTEEELNLKIKESSSLDMIKLIGRYFYGLEKGFIKNDLLVELLNHDSVQHIIRNYFLVCIDHPKNSYPLIVYETENHIQEITLSPFNKVKTVSDLFTADIFSRREYDVNLSFSNLNTLNANIKIYDGLPVETQMDFIKERITKFKKLIFYIEQVVKKVELKRQFQPHLFVNYLRVLDARTQGIKFPEIAKIICPIVPSADCDPRYNEKTVQNYHKTAKNLRDGSYLSLATMNF
ncbi:transcriptional regulator domain-containing protein [Thermodesulfobacteriota bacterium]